MKRLFSFFAAVALSVGLVVGVGISPAQATACSPTCYFYAGSSQTFTAATAPTSVLVSMDVEKPTLGGDYHSLGEIAVQSLDQQQTVEVGWTVSTANPTSDPYLFIGSWKNGVFQGYNNANFTVCTVAICGAAPAAVPGGSLASYVGAASVPTFGITYSGGSYWVKFASTWVGYFSTTNWSGVSPSFVNIPLFQAFDEVAAPNTTPCAMMGSGVQGTSTSPLPQRIGNLTYAGTTTAAAFATPYGTAPYYSAASLSGSVRSFGVGGDNTSC